MMAGGEGALVRAIERVRGRAILEANERALHLFGSVAAAPVSSLTYQDFVRHETFAANCDCKRTFRVALGGREIQRSVADVATAPVALSAFNQPAAPAGASMTDRSQLKAAINLQDGSIGTSRRLLLDIGQTIEFVATCFSIAWLAPLAFIDVTGVEATTTATATGLVIDAFLSPGIWEIEAPTGLTRGVLTQHIRVFAGAQVSIPVPDGAKTVQIVQSAGGAQAALFTMHYGDPQVLALTVDAGVIAFDAGQRRTEIVDMADANFLRTDLDAATNRFFTLVWAIEP